MCLLQTENQNNTKGTILMFDQNSGCLFGFLDFLFPSSRDDDYEEDDELDEEQSKKAFSVSAYKRKFLLTKNELHFYKELKKVADKLNLTVLSKVRMADLVESKNTGKAYYSDFAKIKAKHIDFALCDPSNLYVVLLIELDDNSHSKENTSKRDSFVKSVYQATGYTLYRTRGTANLEKEITAILNNDGYEKENL